MELNKERLEGLTEEEFDSVIKFIGESILREKLIEIAKDFPINSKYCNNSKKRGNFWNGFSPSKLPYSKIKKFYKDEVFYKENDLVGDDFLENILNLKINSIPNFDINYISNLEKDKSDILLELFDVSLTDREIDLSNQLYEQKLMYEEKIKQISENYEDRLNQYINQIKELNKQINEEKKNYNSFKQNNLKLQKNIIVYENQIKEYQNKIRELNNEIQNNKEVYNKKINELNINLENISVKFDLYKKNLIEKILNFQNNDLFSDVKQEINKLNIKNENQLNEVILDLFSKNKELLLNNDYENLQLNLTIQYILIKFMGDK